MNAFWRLDFIQYNTDPTYSFENIVSFMSIVSVVASVINILYFYKICTNIFLLFEETAKHDVKKYQC
jgi:hypothetical protein